MSLFYNKKPLVLNPELACLVGLSEAIVLQQVHYWLEKNRESGRNENEGRYWAYNTVEGWREQFPFWSVNGIRKVLKRLESRGLLMTGNFNKSKFDRTIWYSIDYEAVERLAKVENGSGDQNLRPFTTLGQMEVSQSGTPIPENTREGDGVGLWERLQEVALEKKVSGLSSRQRMNRALKRVK